MKKTFPKLVHLSLFERSSSFTSFIVFTSNIVHIVYIVHIVHFILDPVIRMLFTNDCRSCFPVQNLYKCICSLHMYMYIYVHGCVISLYILYSTLLYCVHLNDIAVNDEQCE